MSARTITATLALMTALALAGCATEPVTTGVASMRGTYAIELLDDATLDGARVAYSGYVAIDDDGNRLVSLDGADALAIPKDAVIEAVGIKDADSFFVYRYAPDGTVTELEIPRTDENYARVLDDSATITLDGGSTTVRFPDFASY